MWSECCFALSAEVWASPVYLSVSAVNAVALGCFIVLPFSNTAIDVWLYSLSMFNPNYPAFLENNLIGYKIAKQHDNMPYYLTVYFNLKY